MPPSRPPAATVTVGPDPGRPRSFVVIVRDGGGESRHRVAVSERDAERFAALGRDPASVVRAAMAFLLDREPKESILPTFDIDVIRRYFPEFDDAFPGYLDRL